MVSDPTVSVSIRFFQCCTCGVTYCIPASLDDQRRKDGKAMYCINGHRSYYRPEPKKEPLPLRRAKIQALHEREQAEARASEAMTKAGQQAGKQGGAL